MFTIGVPNGKRDEAIATLNAAGIHVAVNFRSVPGTRYYTKKYPQALGECPNAGLWGSQTLTLPMYPSLTLEEQDYVIKVSVSRSIPFLDVFPAIF
jgi:UDP-4-amino-4-deoxy-L-arabinose-oxoglutarate aminotransferase